MNDTLLVRFFSHNKTINKKTSVQWGVCSRNKSVLSATFISSLGEIKDQWQQLNTAEQGCAIFPEKMVVFLPGCMTINRRKELNKGQKKHLNSALPYLVEESIADDIESIHIASYWHKKSRQVELVAIPHELIKQFIALFKALELPVSAIYSECQMLTTVPETTTLLLDRDYVLMAMPECATVSMGYAAVPLALSYQAENCERSENVATNSAFSEVRLIYASADQESLSEKIAALKTDLDHQHWLYHEQKIEGDVFDFIAQRYLERQHSGELINLQQGAYRCKRRLSQKVGRWKTIAVVAVIWVVIELGIRVGEGFYFGREKHSIWAESAELYLRVFPNDRQVRDAQDRNMTSFNIQTWLQNRTKRANSAPVTESVFLPLLQTLSKVTAEHSAKALIKPQGLDFNNQLNRLAFDFVAVTLDSVNKLESELQAQGVRTKLERASQEKEGVVARIVLAK